MGRRLLLEEKLKCLRAWRELGDKQAQTLLVESNRGLVKYFAKKYMGQGLTFDELESAGLLGLVRAINMFNYEEKDIHAFTSYISIAIDNEIKMEFRKYNKHSHVLSFDQPIGENKDGDELSLKDIITDENANFVDDVISEMKNDVVRNALQCLTSREKQIILLRYGLNDEEAKTQEEVAEIFGCSKTLILRQEKKAIIKMRHPRNTRKMKDFAED